MCLRWWLWTRAGVMGYDGSDRNSDYCTRAVITGTRGIRIIVNDGELAIHWPPLLLWGNSAVVIAAGTDQS